MVFPVQHFKTVNKQRASLLDIGIGEVCTTAYCFDGPQSDIAACINQSPHACSQWLQPCICQHHRKTDASKISTPLGSLLACPGSLYWSSNIGLALQLEAMAAAAQDACLHSSTCLHSKQYKQMHVHSNTCLLNNTYLAIQYMLTYQYMLT